MKYLIISMLIFTGCSRTKWDFYFKCDNRKVLEVGGCNYSGTCAVRLDDGTIGLMNMPVTGEQYCIKEYIKVPVDEDF